MNITELKKKLTAYNESSVLDHVNTNHIYRFISEKSTADIFNDGAKYQHSQDAKTITALLEITEDMQKALIKSEKRLLKLEDSNCAFCGGSFVAESTITLNAINQTLTATEQKLNKLTEEK